MADRNMGPGTAHSMFMRKNHCMVFFFFASQKCQDLFSQGILQEYFVSKKEKNISTDNSVESSSLSCQQN